MKEVEPNWTHSFSQILQRYIVKASPCAEVCLLFNIDASNKVVMFLIASSTKQI